MTTLQQVVAALDARRIGGNFIARCPAHDDRNPSLSIGDNNGKLLVKCFAGCEQSSIIGALRNKGLWQSERRRVAAPAQGKLIRTYDYTDERGTLLFQVCRFEPKSFRPRRPDGRGGWVWSLGDCRRVLYRLQEVLESPVVFVPEGERDCETLRAYGFVATTNSGGAENWRAEFNVFFRGRDVVILPDADAPGWKRAMAITRGVLPYAATVRVLELKGAKDVTEWFQQGLSSILRLGPL